MFIMKVLIRAQIRTHKFKLTVNIAKIRLAVEITRNAGEGLQLELELRDIFF